MGFEDHRQEVSNLVQALTALFLYSQSEKEMVEECGRNLKSFWDMVEVFGGSPGLHCGIVEVLMKDSTKYVDPSRPTEEEIARVENKANKAIKAVLLISGADK
jgi:hypothetical protein